MEKLSQLRLCISKHRLKHVVCDMGNSVINTNRKNMVVVPTSLKVGLFPLASIDNIDLEIIIENNSVTWYCCFHQ